MIDVHDSLDEYMASTLAESAEAAFPAGTSVLPRVRERMDRRRLRVGRPALLLAGLGTAALVVGTGVAFAAGVLNEPIVVHLVTPSHNPREQGTSTKAGSDASSITIADAETRLGFQLATLASDPNASLLHVQYFAPTVSVDGKEIAHNTGSVMLSYTLNAKTIYLSEELDPNGKGPLRATFKDPQGNPYYEPRVEVIDGAPYLVGRSSETGHQIQTVTWKTSDGTVFHLACESLDTATLREVVDHLGKTSRPAQIASSASPS